MRNLMNSMLALTLATTLGVTVAAQGGGQAPAAPGAPGAAGPQGGPPAGGRGRGFNLPPLLMESDAFPDGGIVPQKYVSANGGPNVQPGFRISNAPQTTQSFAIIFHDIDVALGGNTGDVLHWIAWNIPGTTTQIPEGSLPPGSVQGNNMRNQANYMGPGAPAGPRYHHYVFELYALNSTLDLPPTTTRDQLLQAMQGKVVAKSAYVGRFRGGDAPAGGGRGN